MVAATVAPWAGCRRRRAAIRPESPYAILPAERGVGAASDAVRALVCWLHDRLGVTTVIAEIDDANAPMARVAVAAGFERTAHRAGEVAWKHRRTR